MEAGGSGIAQPTDAQSLPSVHHTVCLMCRRTNAPFQRQSQASRLLVPSAVGAGRSGAAVAAAQPTAPYAQEACTVPDTVTTHR